MSIWSTLNDIASGNIYFPDNPLRKSRASELIADSQRISGLVSVGELCRTALRASLARFHRK